MQFACRIENPERCIKQSAPIAVKNVKFRSNRILAGQFTAEIVGQREDDREDLDIRFYLIAKRLLQFSQNFLSFSFNPMSKFSVPAFSNPTDASRAPTSFIGIASSEILVCHQREEFPPD